jgi:hypothetical protein
MKENQTVNQATTFIKKHTKNVLSVVVAVSIAATSFKLGAKYGNPEKKEIVENPYAHAFSPEEISIAVNESNELIMIERATGKYIVYSDQIGQTIFGMYANRIHQEAINVSK